MAVISAYMARPLGSAQYPGVIVVHHMPDWDEATKEITRRFAHHGYAAVCPNLHFRDGPDASPDDAAAVSRAAGDVPDDRFIGDAEGSVNFLQSLPYHSGKIGMIGVAYRRSRSGCGCRRWCLAVADFGNRRALAWG
jgi:carboxymethylenebutenolidase